VTRLLGAGHVTSHCDRCDPHVTVMLGHTVTQSNNSRVELPQVIQMLLGAYPGSAVEIRTRTSVQPISKAFSRYCGLKAVALTHPAELTIRGEMP
jgi:hypothetical protein